MLLFSTDSDQTLAGAPPANTEETQNLPVEHPEEANIEKGYEKDEEKEINQNIERPYKRGHDNENSDVSAKKLAV
ncbi:unnamed protein product [Bursaphelenchus okinawaensis]|uniref:Uncharacterized protein n=1 Tax=Bursaphelenchus okinawaensis TaxID=465554 RepID=A0A811LAL3_9BILA|nr:unnamed protein product [Bursaphelenchus okinawaensis]CAG9120833.1 unnamed protein product [Bursaphelenchus okinawaensis]